MTMINIRSGGVIDIDKLLLALEAALTALESGKREDMDKAIRLIRETKEEMPHN